VDTVTAHDLKLRKHRNRVTDNSVDGHHCISGDVARDIIDRSSCGVPVYKSDLGISPQVNTCWHLLLLPVQADG
jgi:hypothetical protein